MNIKEKLAKWKEFEESEEYRKSIAGKLEMYRDLENPEAAERKKMKREVLKLIDKLLK